MKLAWLMASVALTGTAASAKHNITTADIAKVKSVGDPQVDPAGKWVVYTVEATDAEADKIRSHVWMTRWDGSKTLQVTGRDGESESTARFSPDGQWLAFLSSRGEKQKDSAVWLMDRDGGEATKLPGIKGSVDDIVWSPDAKSIAMIISDPDPDEEANAAASATPAQAATPGAPQTPTIDPSVVAPAAPSANPGKDEEKRPKPIVIDRFQFKQDVAGYLGKQRSRLWVYDLASRTARRVTTGNFDEERPSWSPDGKSIAFNSNRSIDPDRNYDSNVFVVGVADKPTEPRSLTSYPGGHNEGRGSHYPAWSPDGRRIAYTQGGPVELIGYGVRTLAVVSVNGGAPTILTKGLDRNIGAPVWLPDGRSIRFLVEDDGAQRIAEVAAGGGVVRPVIGDIRVFQAAVPATKGAMAVVLESPDKPAEIYALEGGKLRQLSHQNDAWLADVNLATVQTTSMKGKDGTEVHGFLVVPPGAAPGMKLPTVLFNHGGPQAQFDASFDLTWQLFAGHGYAVVATNPRGSSGRGEAYGTALFGDWGGPAVPDALAGVDDAVARGIADPDRLYIGGWSYGGMLTNYVIASDTRFKAAVSGASISNAFAGYGTDQYIRDYEAELGKPWESQEKWLKVSYPFFHNDRIVTPTLFMVGEKDFNVPALNSEQMYQALQSRGVTTGLIIYPGEFHGLRRPSFLKDRMDRWLAWYDRFGGAK